MRWTENDDLAAFRQGWQVLPTYRTPICPVPGMGVFASDEEALAFVRSQAAKGDALAVKALQLHEAGLKRPERPSEPPIDATTLVKLDI